MTEHGRPFSYSVPPANLSSVFLTLAPHLKTSVLSQIEALAKDDATATVNSAEEAHGTQDAAGAEAEALAHAPTTTTG